MSVKKERTIAVLMRFVITPKDPTPALVNQDMKETEIITQVISCVTCDQALPLPFLFWTLRLKNA